MHIESLAIYFKYYGSELCVTAVTKRKKMQGYFPERGNLKT